MPGLGQLVGHTALSDIGPAQHLLSGHRVNDPGGDGFHGLLQRNGKWGGDLKRYGSLPFEMADLSDAGGAFQL